MRLAATWLAGATLSACAGQLAAGFEEFDNDRGGGRGARDAAAPSDAGAAGVDASEASLPQGTEEWLSNEAMTAMLSAYTYRGQGFRRVNRTPFLSTVSPNKTVTLWITESSYDAFTAISPDEAGSRVALPVGTVIVREVFAENTLDTITVMLRLPDGAFPLGGNWWYAAAGPDGTVRTDPDDGTPLIGLLEDCGTCHLRRSNDDHLFGAPADSL